MKNNLGNSNLLLHISILIAVMVTGSTAYTQDITADVDKIFSWARPDAPGCTVAVSQRGKLVVSRGYGSADLERDVPISPDTIFDAGSVVKQFVAASVLLLVEDGKLSLTDDVRKYIPELPDLGRKVTLDHLLTHTSGLRDWTAIRPMSDGDPTALTMALRQRGLNFIPGDEWSYSNTNYELLKEIVARRSGLTFAQFTQKRLWEPLKLKSTAYVHDMTDVIKRRALAYRKQTDRWKLDIFFGNDRGGSGGLLTTAADLVSWNDALTNGTLGKFVTENLQEPATLNNGRKLTYARGLKVEARGADKLVWHSGGAAGYSTLSARLPAHGLSLAIMCNADGGARDIYASRIFDLFLPPVIPEPNTFAANAGVVPRDLNVRAGLFFNEQNGQAMRLSVNNNNLTIVGGGALAPVSADRFRNRRPSVSLLSEAEFELQFLSADRFEIKTKEGEVTKYRRAVSYAPTDAELKAFAGQYESSEMGATMEIVPEKGGLTMRFFRNPEKGLQLKPVDRDTFLLSLMTVRFVRDENGKVTGYDYSNPLLRNIRYTRLGERAGGKLTFHMTDRPSAGGGEQRKKKLLRLFARRA